MADGLENKPISAIMDVARQALDRDPKWMVFARSALAAIAPQSGHVGAAANARRTAFDLAVAGDLAAAAAALSAGVSKTTDVGTQGWLLEQKATYVDITNPAEAQTILTAARTKNSVVLRPLTGNTYRKLSASNHQAVTASDYLSGRYANGVEIKMGFEAIIEDLRFDPDRTEQFEQALVSLAEHVGLAAQRPEQQIGQGPDGLWALGELKYWVIEAKSGATTDYIQKGYINQLAGSMNWFANNYDASTTAIPILIHPSDTLARDASAPAGARVITEHRMQSLCAALRGFADALVVADRWDQPDEIRALLTGHKLRASDLAEYTGTIKQAGRR